MRALLLPLLLVGIAPARSLDTLAPQAHQSIVAGIVAAGLSEYHYRDRPLDDTLSRCWLDTYLDSLDPRRTMLTAQDLASFSRYETRLDDLLRRTPPDISPGWVIYERWRSRARERVDWTRQALLAEPDLSDAEELLIDRDEAPWPADEAALRELWRLELEDDWLRLSLASEPADIAEDEATPQHSAQQDSAQQDSAQQAPAPTAAETEAERSQRIRDRLGSRMDRLEQDLDSSEPADVLELYLASLASCYDPHSTYLKPFSADDFNISTQGSLEGIGASLQEDGFLIRVQDIITGGPADRSDQLKPDDRIVAVAQGELGEWVDVVGMRLDHVVQLIRGPKGTTVRLEILPAGVPQGGAREEVVLVRDRIDLELVDPSAELREIRSGGSSRSVAVIQVPAFVSEVDADSGEPRPSTTQQVQALLEEHADADLVILDLRENGGGVLDEAVGLTGLFIDRGPVVRIRDGRGKVEAIEDQDRGAAWDKPLIVLTSPFSASASEIVAGALQDWGRALVVGSTTTYGKGSVQTVLPLDQMLAGIMPETFGQNLGGAMKLTFSQYYLPSGRSTQAEGVPSDIVLPSPYEGRVLREADRDNALPPSSIPAASFQPDPTLAALRDALAQRSATRVAASPDFATMEALEAEAEALEEIDIVSLQLDERRAEVEARRARRDALLDDLDDDSDPVLDETLAIAGDLLELLPG